jgi:phosphoketolase
MTHLVSLLGRFTEKELRKWFESSGFNSPPLAKTDERHALRRTRDETLWKLQLELQQAQFEFDLEIAQRCRGWTPQT